MKRETAIWALILIVTMNPAFTYGTLMVSNVTAQQYEGTKAVIITYDLTHSEGLSSTVTIEATSNDEYWEVVNNVTGDVGEQVTEGFGKTILWDAGLEWPAQSYPKVKIRVRANDGQEEPGGSPPKGFSLIPAGPFVMGSPLDELGRSPTEVQHEVTIARRFFMAVNEVTWSEWKTVRDWAHDNGYFDLANGNNGLFGDNSDRHPVTLVSWHDVVKWLNAKSEMEHLTPCYSAGGKVYRTGLSNPVCDFNANGYRLPTEAEWEYACRANSTTAFHTGHIVNIGSDPLDTNLDKAGWYDGNSGFNTHPVGQKQANDWGLLDMHGNVSEWCWDWDGIYPSIKVIDPTGVASGTHRVLRGGSWFQPSQNCRSAHRMADLPGNKAEDLGFRYCLSRVE